MVHGLKPSAVSDTEMMNFENTDKFVFPGAGRYGIPQIDPVTEYPQGEFIPINYAMTAKRPEDKIVHTFVDDYQFVRFWNQPDRYIDRLSKFKAVCSPDFSTYTDMPLAMQIYNHYRKHWLAAYWQMHGMMVYPTISWSDENSYDWCFDGEPESGTVAVSSVGCMNGKKKKELFLSGYNAMIERLHPESIIFYGKVPEECKGNIVRIKPFSDRFSKAICEG